MRRSLLALALISLAAALPAAAQEAEAEPAPPVVLEGLEVQPQSPAVDTLCKLKVKIANRGEKTASQFGFSVKINGQDLVVYRNQLFMYPIEAGESDELQLFNFWSTETSRPPPADGKLKIEVGLLEARWFDISIDDEGVEVWQPVGDVPGLPSTQTVTLEMKR